MKIINLLDQVGPTTWKSFDLFLRSPYFNQDQRLVEYFSVLCTDIEKNEEYNKNQIWLRLFPEQKFNDAHLRQLTHRLLNLYKKFLCSESLKNDNILSHRLLSTWSRDKNLTVLNNELQRIEKKFLTTLDFNESSNLIDLSLANDAIYRIEYGNQRIKNYLTEEVQSRMVLSKYLIQANTTISLIGLYLLSQNHKEISNTKEFIQASDIDEKIDVGQVAEIPLYKLYISIFKLYKYKSSTSDISQCIEVLSHFSNNPNQEITALYKYILNYLIAAINKGQNVGQQLYELLIFGLESSVSVSNNRIESNEFLNVVNLASRIHGKEKALGVINTYRYLLNKDDQNSTVSYSRANIFMRAKEFKEVIRELSGVDFSNVLSSNSRLLQISAFYELEEYEVLVSTIKAFKVFLRRSRKMPKARKQNFLDFCDVVFNLVQATEKSDSKRIAKAQTILDGNQAVPSTWWLKEKIEEASQLLGITSAEL